MKKIYILILILLTGCNSIPPKIEIVKEAIPILYCPAPPIKDLNKPELIYKTLTQEEKELNPNLAIKYFAIDYKQLSDYVNRLEATINKYNEISLLSESTLTTLLNNNEISLEEKNKIKDIINKIKEKVSGLK